MLILRALRRLCEDGPVVCVIETSDSNAGGLWADLVGLFARRVAKDVPLMLVLALDGPKRLGAHEDDEPAALNVARQLTADDVDVATWQWLAPLSVEDLTRWIGPCASGVLGALFEITADRAAGAPRCGVTGASMMSSRTSLTGAGASRVVVSASLTMSTRSLSSACDGSSAMT